MFLWVEEEWSCWASFPSTKHLWASWEVLYSVNSVLLPVHGNITFMALFSMVFWRKHASLHPSGYWHWVKAKKLRFYLQQWCCQPWGLLQSYKSNDNHVSGTNSLTNSVAIFPHWKGSQSNPETRIFISALGRCNCWIHYMSLSYCVCPDFSFIFWVSFPLLPSLPTPAVKPYQTSFLTLFFLF